MPVIEIRALPQDPPVDVPGVLGCVCREVAAATAIPEKQVWATWQTLPDGHYVEGVNDAAVQPFDTHPPLVRVLSFEGRSDRDVESVLEAVARSLAAALKIEEGNVFVVHEQIASGRLFSGGGIVR